MEDADSNITLPKQSPRSSRSNSSVDTQSSTTLRSVHCDTILMCARGGSTNNLLVQQGNARGGRDSTSPLYFVDSAVPSDSDHNYDHHSSEEELEVINSNSTHDLNKDHYNNSPTNSKRKWSQVSENRLSVESSGSSDDEIQGLMVNSSGGTSAVSTPVEFRTSPPIDAHKPTGRSQSPPSKLFHYSNGPLVNGDASGSGSEPPTQVLNGNYHESSAAAAAGGSSSGATAAVLSPRKRHRHSGNRPHHIQRPCLDFEKMQQLKARAVTTWRQGGELSLFCW